jgi:glycerol-3-phosphate O-acyltransferase
MTPVLPELLTHNDSSPGPDDAAGAGDFLPDSFDPSAVELMRALLTKAAPKGHLYPMAMFSYK